MKFQLTHPLYIALLPVVIAWVVYLFLRSDVQINAWRRWAAMLLRAVIASLVVLALAGLQWLQPQEGMNVFFLLDRSDSIPSSQEETAHEYINTVSADKEDEDRAGVLVFGTEAAIEFNPLDAVDIQQINAVVDTERTDIAAAIRLGTAAFPEHGQKRLVLISDGNENLGDAQAALASARSLGVTLDVVPLATSRGRDVSVQRLGLPSRAMQGQPFEAKIFVNSDQAQNALLRLYQNDQYIGEQEVTLAEGKNLFTFPQELDEPGFYSYTAQVEASGDLLPQNNRASSFVNVRGEPRVLLVSGDPEKDQLLAQALRESRLDVSVVNSVAMTESLPEMQSYDSIFLSNVPAGDLGRQRMRLLESAVQDFGVGLVCIGGDNAFTAGGYKNTPLDDLLPVSNEISSKKVMPNGALVIVCHATEFPNGNQWARDIAFAALQALGPQDEMGIVLWDGYDRWLFELQEVGDGKRLGQMITGMNPGDMPSFVNVMQMAHQGLKESNANLKHMVVFSDGDPNEPSPQEMQAIVNDRITISTVMIGGHVQPDRMIWMAELGNGRFYDVKSPADLPQIFVKEAAVILKSAIIEDPFQPQFVVNSEVVSGLGSTYPILQGYVVTESKPRAEMPLVTDKGDPLLAHWQYGLGRVAAFTSDARARWASEWLTWGSYRQFWSQVASWSLRRLENADFTAEVAVEQGEGQLSVEALDSEGNFRNFLNLEASVTNPEGETERVRLEQTGPGRYEAQFTTREVGDYVVNLMELEGGDIVGAMPLGASVNYSPEFNDTSANAFLLRQLAEDGNGQILDLQSPQRHSFQLNRQETYQPHDLWEQLLKLAVLLFILDVAIRRIQLGREEWERSLAWARRNLFFWDRSRKPVATDESLSALLKRRDQIRSSRPQPVITPTEELFKPKHPRAEPAESPKAPAVDSPQPPKPEEKKESDKDEEDDSVTGRLLKAKRRARKK